MNRRSCLSSFHSLQAMMALVLFLSLLSWNKCEGFEQGYPSSSASSRINNRRGPSSPSSPLLSSSSFSPPSSQSLHVPFTRTATTTGGASSSSSIQVEASQPSNHGSGPGITVRDGRFLTFGFSKRSWKACMLICLNALLLAGLRRRFLPFRRTWSLGKGASPIVSTLLGMAFHLLEAYIYSIPLLQLHLQVFHSPETVTAETLGLPNSLFIDISDLPHRPISKGLKIHALVHHHHEDESTAPRWPAKYIFHFNHGFGASSLSFEPVLATTATFFNATAIAHDAPGFGLTAEPCKSEDGLYSFYSNSLLGTALVKEMTDYHKELCMEEGTAHAEPLPVFVGHSMGSLTSSFMALRRVKQEDGPVILVLVAPAILPMKNAPKGLPPTGRRLGVFPRIGKFFWQTLRIRAVTMASLRLFLRSLVYSNDFWKRGLTLAWGTEGRRRGEPGEGTIAHYCRPSLKEGWDVSLSRFVLAPLQHYVDPKPEDHVNEGYENLVDSLRDQVSTGRLKLVIVHGSGDMVVPVSNSRRLIAAIPGARLIEMPGCGHVPHEEEPVLFMNHLRSVMEEE